MTSSNDAGSPPDDDSRPDRPPGRFKRLGRWFWARPLYMIATILVVGGAAGVAAWGGFTIVIAKSNTLEFCVSCHEMRENIFVEYKQTIHYSNRTGVRAICADCHVPKAWIPKIIRKIASSHELFHHLAGDFETREEFDSVRLELVEKVWDTMVASDSKPCRNCHSRPAMAIHLQSRRAQEKMQEGLEAGKTCIECHKGIAHKLPAELLDDDD